MSATDQHLSPSSSSPATPYTTSFGADDPSPPPQPQLQLHVMETPPTHPLIEPEPDRPPGGTRRLGGVKTPRRVQWLDGEYESESDAGMRGLDERGVNPEPFETLTSALEWHRSSRFRPRSRSQSHPRPHLLHDHSYMSSLSLPASEAKTDQNPDPSSSSSSPSTPFSAASDLPLNPSYSCASTLNNHNDRARDPELGLPQAPPASTNLNLEHSAMDTISIPGETSIPAHETAGLPGAGGADEAGRRAAEVVRVHSMAGRSYYPSSRRRWMGRVGVGLGNVRNRHVRREDTHAERDTDVDIRMDIDDDTDIDGSRPHRHIVSSTSPPSARARRYGVEIEHNRHRIDADVLPPPPMLPAVPLGGGILSSLLSLYAHDAPLPAPGTESESGYSTPATTRSSFDESRPVSLSPRPECLPEKEEGVRGDGAGYRKPREGDVIQTQAHGHTAMLRVRSFPFSLPFSLPFGHRREKEKGRDGDKDRVGGGHEAEDEDERKIKDAFDEKHGVGEEREQDNEHRPPGPRPLHPTHPSTSSSLSTITLSDSTYADDKLKRLSAAPSIDTSTGGISGRSTPYGYEYMESENTGRTPLLGNTPPSPSPPTETPPVPAPPEHARALASSVAIDINVQGADTPSHSASNTSPVPSTADKPPPHLPSPSSSSFMSHLRVGSSGLGTGGRGRPAWTAALSLRDLSRPGRWSRSATPTPTPTPGTPGRITPGGTGTTPGAAGTVASEADGYPWNWEESEDRHQHQHQGDGGDKEGNAKPVYDWKNERREYDRERRALERERGEWEEMKRREREREERRKEREERKRREREREERRRVAKDERAREKEERRRRREREIIITRHVTSLLQRHAFICKLTRAMMLFGAPSHRLTSQIQATAHVLDVPLSCMYLPDVMLLSFDDPGTGTSSVRLIKQCGVMDVEKLGVAYGVYWKVIHDLLPLSTASALLDDLIRRPPLYSRSLLILFGGMCSAFICSVSFNGSFIDSLVSFPLGCLLIMIQTAAGRHELYSHVFEITVATLFSFIAAALSTTGHFCYSSVAASSVVLILPGYIILCGIVDLSSHNLVSGAVRVCFSLIYSLFLGFGLAIGATAYSRLSGHALRGQDDITCSLTHHPDGPWYQQTPDVKWAFLTVPMYSLWLSLRFYAPWNRKEMLLLVSISCLGWAINHFVGLKFPGKNDVSSAAAALVVGFVSNLYARFFKGNAFIIMITAILFQLPSGVANGGLFSFVSASDDEGQSSNQVYLSGFQTALQLVSVALGLTVGLGVSLVLVFPIESRRRKAGVFSL